MGTSLDLEVYSKSNFFGYISNPQKSYATFFLGGTDNIILVQLILIIQQFTKKSFLSLFLNYSLKFTQARCHQVPCVIFPLCPILRCYCTPENGMMDALIDLSSGMDVTSRQHYFLYTCLKIWVIVMTFGNGFTFSKNFRLSTEDMKCHHGQGFRLWGSLLTIAHIRGSHSQDMKIKILNASALGRLNLPKWMNFWTKTICCRFFTYWGYASLHIQRCKKTL